MRKSPRKIGAGRLLFGKLFNKILASCGINVLQLFYGFCFVFLFLAAHFLWHKKTTPKNIGAVFCLNLSKAVFAEKAELSSSLRCRGIFKSLRVFRHRLLLRLAFFFSLFFGENFFDFVQGFYSFKNNVFYQVAVYRFKFD